MLYLDSMPILLQALVSVAPLPTSKIRGSIFCKEGTVMANRRKGINLIWQLLAFIQLLAEIKSSFRDFMYFSKVLRVGLPLQKSLALMVLCTQCSIFVQISENIPCLIQQWVWLFQHVHHLNVRRNTWSYTDVVHRSKTDENALAQAMVDQRKLVELRMDG